MNKKQKALTVAFLVLFMATLVWFPWMHSFEVHYHYGDFAPVRIVRVEYRFFLNPPSLGFSSENVGDWSRPEWTKVGLEWTALAVAYAGLFFVLKGRNKRDQNA